MGCTSLTLTLSHFVSHSLAHSPSLPLAADAGLQPGADALPRARGPAHTRERAQGHGQRGGTKSYTKHFPNPPDTKSVCTLHRILVLPTPNPCATDTKSYTIHSLNLTPELVLLTLENVPKGMANEAVKPCTSHRTPYLSSRPHHDLVMFTILLHKCGHGPPPRAQGHGQQEGLARHPTTDTLNPAPYTIHPAPCTLHPAPCTLHPTSYTLHPAPYIVHPATCTLHPAPCTLHPAPCTLHPHSSHGLNFPNPGP